MPGVPVTFDPPGVTVVVPEGTTVLEAARRAGIPLPSTCGGRGTCGDCAVRVLKGSPEPPGETEAASLAGAPPSVRLACLLRAFHPLVVRPVAKLAAVTVSPVARLRRGPLVAAVDLGTTTISAQLLSESGELVAQASQANPQRTYGADVATRISLALEGRAEDLRGLATQGISLALRATGIALDDLVRIAVAGNTAMVHLAVGAEVAGLGAHPYEGCLGGSVVALAGALGMADVPARAEVVFLPAMASFVGGDVTAGVLATALDAARDVRVLVDLGTNAEVVVSVGGALTVTSAAAGPAFEAAGLSCGMAAVNGAVCGARWNGERLALEVVGGGAATGICGSGALALVGALLDAGHLDSSGRLLRDGPFSERMHERGDILTFQVDGEAAAERDVYLTQLDVRELQLAKAAVATALELTLAKAGVGFGDVAELMVAGAFGAGVHAALLRRLGVVPALRGSVTPIGDSALAGAALVAVDPQLLPRAEEIAREARHVDLAADPAFQSTFLARTELAPLP